MRVLGLVDDETVGSARSCRVLRGAILATDAVAIGERLLIVASDHARNASGAPRGPSDAAPSANPPARARSAHRTKRGRNRSATPNTQGPRNSALRELRARLRLARRGARTRRPAPTQSARSIGRRPKPRTRQWGPTPNDATETEVGIAYPPIRIARATCKSAEVGQNRWKLWDALPQRSSSRPCNSVHSKPLGLRIRKRVAPGPGAYRTRTSAALAAGTSTLTTFPDADTA
jgi:hypothetical protein